MVRENISERELLVRLALLKYYEREDGYCYFKKDDYRNLSIFNGEKSIIASFKCMEKYGYIKNDTINGYVSKYKILIDNIKCYDFLLNKKLKISEMSLLYFLALNSDGRDWISSKYVCKLLPIYKTKTMSNMLSDIRKVLDIERTINNLIEVKCDNQYLVDGYTKTDNGIFYGNYSQNKKCVYCGEEDDNSFSFRNYHVCKKCALIKSDLNNSNISSRLLRRSKSNARLQEFDHDLTKEYIESLLKKQEFKCAYSGLNFDLSSQNTCPSIDRIDSSKGYIKGNIAIVLTSINKMKSNHTMEHFKELINSLNNNIDKFKRVK